MRKQPVRGYVGCTTTLRAGVFLIAALVNGLASAAPGDLLFTLTAPEPQGGGLFGFVVSSVDSDVVVSERNRFTFPIDARGRAYVFDGQTGQVTWIFDNPEPTDQDQFARAITGGDGRVFVSTIGVQERVYEFSASNGTLLHSIPNPVPNNNFGTAISYSNGSLVVSAPAFSQPGLESVGRAYLFNAATGQLHLPLPNPEPKAGDGFGSGGTPLAISGNNALLGAIADDLPGDTHPDGDNPGRVWVFNRETGGVVLTLENPNPQARPSPSDGFGWSVAVGSGIIAVGALRDSTSGVEQSGTVYIFDSETGALEHTLFSPHLIARASFGQTLAITPDGNVLVGDWHAWVDGLEDAGRAYLFDGQTGNLLLDIPNPDPKAGDAFGWSVAASNRGMIIGAPTVDSNGLLSSGAVYVFEEVPEPGTVVTGLVGAVIGALFSRSSLGKKRMKP